MTSFADRLMISWRGRTVPIPVLRLAKSGIYGQGILHRATGFPYISPISSGLRWRGERYIPKNVFFLRECRQ
jgi:hypothetical protein